jgi:hypothetical protein
MSLVVLGKGKKSFLIFVSEKLKFIHLIIRIFGRIDGNNDSFIF